MTTKEPFAKLMAVFLSESPCTKTNVGSLKEQFEKYASLPNPINGQPQNGTRCVFGIPRLTYELYLIYKSESFVFGDATYTLTPCSSLQDPIYFEPIFANTLFIVDLETLNPQKSFTIQLI